MLRHAGLAPRLLVQISVACLLPDTPATVARAPMRHPLRTLIGPCMGYSDTGAAFSEASDGFSKTFVRMLCETRVVGRAETLGREGDVRRPSCSDLRGVTLTMSVEACSIADALPEHHFSQVARLAILSELERQGWAHESSRGECLLGVRTQASTLRQSSNL